LKIFNSENIRSEAQLLVASHDTALLDKRILRRDQICIVEKNQFGSTELTSLVEFKPRKESPYDKSYLDGKYGGIPMISDLEEIFKP
jgi:AAA15 family ATPase/GTPase